MAENKAYSLETETLANGILIRLTGVFNSTSTAEIKPQLLKAAEQNNVFLDLSQVSMLTSAGVGALFELADITSRKGIAMVIINPSERVRQVINLTGFNEMFRFARDLDEAQQLVTK